METRLGEEVERGQPLLHLHAETTGELAYALDYAQPEGTSYTELSGNYRQPLFGGAFRANGLFKSSQMFADVRHDITYPAPALILATERNNTRATEAQVGYDRGIGAKIGRASCRGRVCQYV